MRITHRKAGTNLPRGPYQVSTSMTHEQTAVKQDKAALHGHQEKRQIQIQEDMTYERQHMTESCAIQAICWLPYGRTTRCSRQVKTWAIPALAFWHRFRRNSFMLGALPLPVATGHLAGPASLRPLMSLCPVGTPTDGTHIESGTDTHYQLQLFHFFV